MLHHYTLSDDDLEIIRAMISDELVMAHRARGLSPENPFIFARCDILVVCWDLAR